MAQNKNQHFVPRCYLKQFSKNSEGIGINLYNIERKKVICSASLKNQCSKNYFYGKGPELVVLENMIQSIEQSFASTIKEITLSLKLTVKNEFYLKRFWLLQYLRTEAASERTVKIQIDMVKLAREDPNSHDISIKSAALLAMEMYKRSPSMVDDMEVCLLLNKTKLPFITSDDPAILSNRWHLYDTRTKNLPYGLYSAGNLLLLPITPNIFCLGYDKSVYLVSHKNKLLNINDERDVEAINQHQVLNCKANLYIKEDSHIDLLMDSIIKTTKQRPTERHESKYALMKQTNNGLTQYEYADPNKISGSHEAMIQGSILKIEPTSWPSLLKLRESGSVFTDGSTAGYLRPKHIPSERKKFFSKENIKLKKAKRQIRRNARKFLQN